MVPGLVVDLVGVVKVIEGGENIIFDDLCWVGVQFLVSGSAG